MDSCLALSLYDKLAQVYVISIKRKPAICSKTLKDCFTLLRSILMQRTYRTGTWQKGSRCGTGYDAKTSSGTLTTFTLISFLPTAALTTTTRTTRSRRKNLFRGTKERGTTSNHSSSSLQTLIFAYRLAQKIK